jgi:NAD(P)-dependent dehydrogenase (short-subunit alcohol dehydrogenase family)
MHTCLVTGANRGIGLRLVTLLKAQGRHVIATARDPDAAETLQGLADQIVPLDVADAASIAKLPAHLGDRPIDLLINNAGVSSETKTLAACDPADMTRTFAVNAIGPILVTRALIDLLRLGKARTIIQITSQLGSIANNTGGSSYAYRGSKAALNQMNRSLANELAPENFTCVAIHPGWVQTDMGGPKAPLTPDQSAAAILATISRLTTADTGKFLNYDGAPLPW